MFLFRFVLLPTNRNSKSRGYSPGAPFWGVLEIHLLFLNFGPGELPLSGLDRYPLTTRFEIMLRRPQPHAMQLG